jgi:hypothetical protein
VYVYTHVMYVGVCVCVESLTASLFSEDPRLRQADLDRCFGRPLHLIVQEVGREG